ncbi:hypothetical protein L7F22_027610 [Adiantum nelumboides]|nr:hypothetical protein [Adiantum nelumboides]
MWKCLRLIWGCTPDYYASWYSGVDTLHAGQLPCPMPPDRDALPSMPRPRHLRGRWPSAFAYRCTVLRLWHFPYLVYMDLHIISWNVNGMHFTSSSGPQKLKLRREIATHVSRPMDILLVQEHKLSYAHTQRCGKLLPGGSHTFWEPTVGDHLSSGGVCISVGSRWLPRVIDHGTLVAGRAMWISLQCDASVVGILCIYAPTTAAERSWLWDQIVHVLPPVDSWIVGGDFNNVETFEGRGYVASTEKTMGKQKQASVSNDCTAPTLWLK